MAPPQTSGEDRSTAARIAKLAAGFGVPFLLVFYLAFREGGYDEIVRSEVGVVVWWLILLGAALGLIPRPISRGGWLALGALTALAVWNGLGILWSESAGASAQELARVATLLGVFVLALALQGPRTLRLTVGGVASAVSLIGLIALASRFQPTLFPASEVAEVLPSERARLNYPLAYWNALAELVAIGLPLLLWAASDARSIAIRAASAAVLPALTLTVYLTLSRGGALAALISVGTLVALHPQRLRLLPPMLLAGIGSIALVLAAEARPDLTDGLLTDAAHAQGDAMSLITFGVCLLVGGLFAGYALAERRDRLVIPRVGLRRARIGLAVVAAALLTAFLAVGGPGRIADGWEQFKQPVTPGDDSARFESASGSGRYQWWEAAIDATGSEPVLGIGPGSFELWFARQDDVGELGPVRDAHSLYIETLAELGVVGLLILLGFLGTVVYGSGRLLARNWTDSDPRALSAAAIAGALAFLAAAAIDFAWEMTVLPACFLLLAAAILAPPRQSGETATEPGERRPARRSRVALAGLAVAGILVIVPLMMSASRVRESQSQVRDGDLAAAIESAREAEGWLPFAAEPPLQQALVLELAGELDPALGAAKEAVAAEPTNWETWLLLSRIQAELGRVGASTRSFLEARSLNPRSPLFEE